MSAPIPVKKDGSKGCCVGGCIFFGVVLLVFLGTIGFGAFTFYKAIQASTSETAATVPVEAGTPAQEQEVHEKLAKFFAEGTPVDKTIRLSASDINLLIARDAAVANLKGHVFIRIEKGLIYADLGGVPLDLLHFPGRYLNGTVGLEPKVEDGLLNVLIKSVLTNGNQLPEQYVKAMQTWHFGRALTEKDPEARRMLSEITSAKVDGDVLVLERK